MWLVSTSAWIYALFKTQDRDKDYVLCESQEETLVTPKDVIWKKVIKYFVVTIIGLSILAFILTFIVLPLVFMVSVALERLLMFTNFGLTTNPNDFNVHRSFIRNMHLTFQDSNGDNVTLGVWHVLPSALSNMTDFDAALRVKNFSVIMHFHGSGETRLDSFNMIRQLKNLSHVIAFDYRGYADSSSVLLTEEGIARDAVQLYNWIRSKTDNDIYVWGHSLGSALSTLTLEKLKDQGTVPAGLILESAFTNMREEIPVHPYGKIFAWLPYFKQTVQDPLERHGFRFNSSKHILSVDCPIMFLHSQDDSIVPIELGRKLAAIARTQRGANQGPVIFHEFPASCRFDHFFIFRSKHLHKYIREFMLICNNFNLKQLPTSTTQ